jgi:hypothetical protein
MSGIKKWGMAEYDLLTSGESNKSLLRRVKGSHVHNGILVQFTTRSQTRDLGYRKKIRSKGFPLSLHGELLRALSSESFPLSESGKKNGRVVYQVLILLQR